MESFRSIPFQANHPPMHIGIRPFSRGSIGRDGSFEWNRFIWKNDKKLLLFPWISSYDKYDDLDREESRFKISCTSF